MKKYLFLVIALILSLGTYAQTVYNYKSSLSVVERNGESFDKHETNFFSFKGNKMTWISPGCSNVYQIQLTNTTEDNQGNIYYHFKIIGIPLTMIIVVIDNQTYLILSDGNTIITFECNIVQ